jgi:hypothetical protein
VDALQRIHIWLRPAGLLLDLHPEPDNPEVEVGLTGTGSTRLGGVDSTALIANIRAARAAVASAVERQWFAQEGTLTFDFISHFTNVDEWLAHREERRSTSQLKPAIVERARELLSLNRGAELLIRERVLATRLRQGLPLR